jgi:hypothetical protein
MLHERKIIRSGTFCGGDIFCLDKEPFLGMPLEHSKSGERRKRLPDRRWPGD